MARTIAGCRVTGLESLYDSALFALPVNVTLEKCPMKKNLLVLAALAVLLAGCVVVPARPLYVHAPRVVVY
jgi:hypothetical protein